MLTLSLREGEGAEKGKHTDPEKQTCYQFARIHGLLELLAERGARSHHGPQHVPSGQVANTVLVC